VGRGPYQGISEALWENATKADRTLRQQKGKSETVGRKFEIRTEKGGAHTPGRNA